MTKKNTLEDSHRNLFELPSPFDSFNERCEEACLYGEEFPLTDVVEFPMACPKCPEEYTPCNSCCYGGASSLKLKFFACPGTLSFAIDQLVDDCGDEYYDNVTVADNNNTLTSVHFVDCDCFDNATNLDDMDAVMDASTTCELYEEIPLDYDTMDVCLVATSRSTTMDDDDFVLDLSVPLPEIIGLQHDPYFDYIAGIDDPTILGTTVTYFDTTCLSSTAPHLAANPLFPGYGKFAATCPDTGFIDFEYTGVSPLPDAIDHFDGTPPATSFYYEFVDGTSVGFWPDDSDMMDQDDVFFLPNFATCACRDCNDNNSADPSQSPSVSPSLEASNAPTIMASAQPSLEASNGPSVMASAQPSLEASNEPSVMASAQPSVESSNKPSLFFSSEPSTASSSTPTSTASSQPSVESSNAPSTASSSTPTSTASSQPSVESSNEPSLLSSSTPTTAASSQPSSAPSPLNGGGTPSSELSISPTQESMEPR
ncbi:MAG: hypothetical protein SGARI_000982 [Bacillariaceae sp.]